MLHVFVEVVLAKELDPFFDFRFLRINTSLDAFNQECDGFVLCKGTAFGIGQHEQQFGSLPIVMSQFKVFQQEEKRLMNEVLSTPKTVLQVRDNLDEEDVPVQVDVQGFHVEVHHINQILLALVVMESTLLLVILVLGCLNLVEGVLVVEKRLNQFVDAEFLGEGKFSQFSLREESLLEGDHIVGDQLNDDHEYLAVLLGDGLVKVVASDVEVDEDLSDEGMQPLDLPQPVEANGAHHLVDYPQEVVQHAQVVLVHKLQVLVLQTHLLGLRGSLDGHCSLFQSLSQP